MNKSLDERLVPNGEYIDALNIRMGSTEKSEIGVIENSKGNSRITQLKYIDGTPLSSSARCIGAIDDSSRETIYWFVHDPDFSVGATGKLDMIVSYSFQTNSLFYHVISINDGDDVKTTLNFDPKYLITGVDLVDNLLLFTDGLNQPRFINVRGSYPYPVSNVDQFTEESILVIKRPPLVSPSISLVKTNSQDNFLENRFICFAYRYRYGNNEYSAISPFSPPAFSPSLFDFSINSFLNEGMVNSFNAVVIRYNSGGSLVKGIDLLFKETTTNQIKVIEKLDKDILGLSDNTEYTYTFSNSKIFTVLPESELLRLYDNVPITAKAQTVMGNRLMYGNYTEGYDMVDSLGNAVNLTYEASLVSQDVESIIVANRLDTGSYLYGSLIGVVGSVIYIDLADVELVAGASITIELRITHDSFAGNTPYPSETTLDLPITLSYTLNKNYSSVYELASSIEFQQAVGNSANILPVQDSCSGNTFTDQFNCAIPNTLDTLVKYESGLSLGGQGIMIITSPSSGEIGFQIPAMRFVNDLNTPTFNVYEYYTIDYAESFYQNTSSVRSLHSNRGYEIGIVYMDEFGRSSTALVSQNNSVHVPCSASDTKNSIQVAIPVSQRAPYWATKYKFVIKPDEENYETIYCNTFFNDPLTNNTYFLLEGENAQKIQQGDRLIVKTDTSGATNTCVYTTVLEKEAQQEGFLEIKSELDPTVNINIPSGVYMKINANNFATVRDEDAIIAAGTIQIDENNAGDFPRLLYPMNRLDTVSGLWEDYDVPAGSKIKINFKFQRLGTGDGNNACERRIYTLEKLFIASANYNNMKDWWDGDNVFRVLNDGISEVGADGQPIDNEYIDTLASSPTDIPVATNTNYYRFYRDSLTNKLSLIITGTRRCTGILSKEKRRSTIIANVEVFRTDSTIIFETEPSDALPDVFFENHLTFGIDSNGNHLGNIQNQNIQGGIPAIVDTEFFNCFVFGNGAESYKIRDSIVGKTFNLGTKVTSVSAQDYKRANRFADITYSGVYNDESNVNKLNEFNLGLINFKPLEDSFGAIQILDARQTDILVLQEDKISYVLAGKNLLSDAAAGGAITSVPEVLGTQLARAEKYGISFNPESYIQWGYDRFFTDAKRGAVIQIRGNSYSTDQLRVISEQGMRSWFRDEFINSFKTEKLGGFDPYMNEYVLSSNDNSIPIPEECVDCGTVSTFRISAGESAEYCVEYVSAVGASEVVFSVAEGSTSEFSVEVSYNNVVVSSGVVSESGTLSVNKTSNTINKAYVTINAIDDLEISVNVKCPEAELITIVSVCVTANPDVGKFIHNEYRYVSGSYISPVQSTLVEFTESEELPVVSQYDSITGAAGAAGFPVDGSTMYIASNKIGFDNFVFNIASNKLRFLRSNTLYENNQSDISALLAASASLPISGSGNFYYGTFTVPSIGQYLYLVWDYREVIAVPLCYSETSQSDSCCGCEGDVAYPLDLCYSTVSSLDACCNCDVTPVESFPVDLCFTGVSSTDACCNCDIVPVVSYPVALCFTGVSSFDACCNCDVTPVVSYPLDLCFTGVSSTDACCNCDVTPVVSYPLSLCFTGVSATDACCNCDVTPVVSYPLSLCFTGVSETDACCNCN